MVIQNMHEPSSQAVFGEGKGTRSVVLVFSLLCAIILLCKGRRSRGQEHIHVCTESL